MSCVSRSHVQIISLSLFILGTFCFITDYFEIGAVLTGVAFYMVIMSESILLGRVQYEMSASLEILRKKQETDIQDLLVFLRHMQLATSPFETVVGAKRLCEKIKCPAMVLTTTHQIIAANKCMHDLLGWDSSANTLNGKPVYMINDPALLSNLGSLVGRPEVQGKISMSTCYAYIHKSGEKIHGHLDVHKVGEEGFFAMFRPEIEQLISRKDVSKIINSEG